MPLLTREQKIIYLAGFFDGEGCVSVNKDNKSGYHWFSISVSQRTTEVLNLFIEVFGGRVVVCKSKRSKFVQFYWRMAGRNGYKALFALLPYLVVKKDQATLGLAFYKQCVYLRKKSGSTTRKLTRLELVRRDKYVSELRTLRKVDWKLGRNI